MTWKQNSDKAFPARHPREPGGLRQDILDEIADHLACAAEAEIEAAEDGGEEAVWRRTLDRFGDPDAMARRLWWDRMKEIIMREWIQTGVMVAAALAVFVGAVFMGIMLGRVNVANETMATAMEQVAASNQALLAAINKLGPGESAGAAQELSTIEVVVRRGAESGPPAPEVRVELKGKGPNDQTMTVPGALDSDGRVVFERLYQGTYDLNLEDPYSGLFAGRSITLFAGKGEGEYVIVAPDVGPRPIHVDWGLPSYAPDDGLFVTTVLESSWKYGDDLWVNVCGAVSTRAETRQLGERAPYMKTSHTIDRTGADGWDTLAPVEMAGSIAVRDRIGVASSQDGRLLQLNNTTVSLDRSVSAIATTARLVRPLVSTPIAPPAVNEVSSGVLQVELPSLIRDEYERRARLARNLERIGDEQYEPVLEAAAISLANDLVVNAGGAHEQHFAAWVDRQSYTAADDPPHYVGELGDGFPHVMALPLPLFEVSASQPRSLFVAVPVGQLRRFQRSRSEGERPAHVPDISGNTLAAYAMRLTRADKPRSSYTPEQFWGNSEVELDDEPFWHTKSESLTENMQRGVLFIPVPSRTLDQGPGPVLGALLRWENESEEYYWRLDLVDRDGTGDSPCWVVTEPADGGVIGPLDDIDGLFHYDALQPVVPVPAE